MLSLLQHLPRAAKNSWQPGSLQSCTLMDTWIGASEKSCSFSPDCSWTSTWWSCRETFAINVHSQEALINLNTNDQKRQHKLNAELALLLGMFRKAGQFSWVRLLKALTIPTTFLTAFKWQVKKKRRRQDLMACEASISNCTICMQASENTAQDAYNHKVSFKYLKPCCGLLQRLTLLMSCSPVSEAVMSLHRAWRAGGGRPEDTQDERALWCLSSQRLFHHKVSGDWDANI